MAQSKASECESDEDCEVYFLKPVNEYNIVEKIKEANKQLFGETFKHSFDDNVCAEDVGTVSPDDDSDDTGPSRKVTFAPNLENYEPDSGIMLETLELDKEFKACVAEAKELERKLNAICKFESIVEESNNTDEEEEVVSEANVETCAKAVVESEQSALLKSTAACNNDDVVEEICEEIIVMDMESEKSAINSPTKLKSTTLAHPQRRMVKVCTFDCAEQDPPQTPPLELEQDNKSLINLLTSDGEEECCSAATFDINVDNSDLDVDDIEADTSSPDVTHNSNTPHADAADAEDNDNNADVDDDDDDDDDDGLSLIVASYLPDDYECKRLERPTSGRAKPNSSKSRRLLAPFSKRFSFRRKSKPLARNSIGTATSNRAHIPPPEVTDLKFNYRTCCEYRRHLAQPEKLPKYTGYMSEYGLSREQLEHREEHLQRKQRFVLEHALKANEADIRKMQDNERAFTTWLRNKMRYPINKTRNMFDVKRRSLDGGDSKTKGSGKVK